MKYTTKRKTRKGETRWFFHPPADAKYAGVVSSCTFSDGRTARFEIPKLIEKVEAFRRGEIALDNIGPSSKVKHVVSHYLNSQAFKDVSGTTQSL